MNALARANPHSTFSVCPVCLQRIPAVLEHDEKGEVRMRKSCPVHGSFSTVVWRGEPERSEWTRDVTELPRDFNPDCPTMCGLCPGHRQSTCCIQLEVTLRCNLSCRDCLAQEAMFTGRQQADPSLSEVQSWITDIVSRGMTFLQITGGEPTLRDDLPAIIRFAKESGCEYVQLNSNGLRLASDEAYVEALAEAGLSFVFLQFDSLDDAVYRVLRGRDCVEQKKMAVEMCGRHNIGVTLVPTLVPELNDKEVGDILRYAVGRSPVVRGVHYQPISFFGRRTAAPRDQERLTLPEVLRAVYAQAGDFVPVGSLVPSHCDHAACGFHGGYIVTPQGLTALTPQQGCSCRPLSPAEKNRQFVGRRWQRPPQGFGAGSDCCDLSTLDGFIRRSRTHAFTISAMAFQDAFTLDIERLSQCSLHVYTNGRVVPFCVRHLMSGSSSQWNSL